MITIRSIKSMMVRPGNCIGQSKCLVAPVFFATLLLFSPALIWGQDDDPSATAPPPLKSVSKEEREKLNNEKGINDRTKLALELMNARMLKAEASNAQGDLDGMFKELGGFHALMDDALEFLGGNQRLTGKVLDNFKRFEIGLRRFTPRLELIRRNLPVSHEFYLRNLLRQIREARSKATEPLFGDSVLPNNKT